MTSCLYDKFVSNRPIPATDEVVDSCVCVGGGGEGGGRFCRNHCTDQGLRHTFTQSGYD